VPTPNLVSVIMPAFNVAGFVEEAVRSVAAQTWPDVELIFIDDGSTDGTAGIAERLAADWTGSAQRRMIVERQRNAGAATARNAGLRAGRGEYLLFADADDRLHPHLVEQLVEALRQDPTLDLVFPRWRYIDHKGEPLGMVSAAANTRFNAADLMQANPIHTATGVLVRASAAARAGWFDESLRACIDLDFWVRIAPGDRRIGGIDAILADYRKRPGQITADWRRMEHHWTRVADKMRQQGFGLSAREWRKGRVHNCIYWATLAFDAGDHASARSLMSEAWSREPWTVATDRLGLIRTAACLAALIGIAGRSRKGQPK